MKITVLTVGKIKEKFYTAAIDEYSKQNYQDTVNLILFRWQTRRPSRIVLRKRWIL